MKKHFYQFIKIFIIFAFCFLQCETKVNDSKFELSDPVDPGPMGNTDTSTIKILFIGNSLTYYNSQPYILWYLANAAGKKLYVDQATIPGAQLSHHVEIDFTKNKIKAQKWDYVILQEAIGELAFPDYHQRVMANIQILKDNILANHSKTKIIYFLPWASKGGVQSNLKYYSYADFQTLLREGAVAIAQKMDLIIAPVGWAWYHVIQARSDINLYALDGSHPALEGTYLGACVYYATIFQETVVNNPYTTLPDKSLANYLQEVASKTVLDSLEYWNIKKATFVK